MDYNEILKRIGKTESPLKRQLLMVALISHLLEKKGKEAPIVIGGCALSYYSREVYFTADIDLAYPDVQALDAVLRELGFDKEGRLWINDELKLVVEVPVSFLIGEDSPVEVAEFSEGLRCNIIGVEDLIIDRLNACKHGKSGVDCEMVELLVHRYSDELDWQYLEGKAVLPENDTIDKLRGLRFKK